MTARSKVLVLGDDTRSFLTIARSLGRAGHTVHAAPFNFRSPALHSRYIDRVHFVPYFMGDGAAWRDGVEALWASAAFDLAVPCDERSLLPFDFFRDHFSSHGRLVAMPTAEQIGVFFDKQRTRELALRLGIPVAPGRHLNENDTAEKLAAEFGLPLAVKPRRSYALETLHARGRVVLATDVAELAKAIERADLDTTLIEGFVDGQGLGISILAERGEVLQAFQHHRAHDDPAVGGSYYRYSAPLSTDLCKAVEKMVAELHYTGVAMFEFRRDPGTGAFWLLEVNARPWGSMPLPVGLGIDFPELWRKLLVENPRTQPRAYRSGVYGRNLVPDTHHLLLMLRRLRRRPLAAAGYFLRWCGDFHRVLVGREISDTLVWDDPRPGFAELGETAGSAAGRLVSRTALGKRFEGRRDRKRAVGRLQPHASNRRFVLFLCQGNICRSPFAENLFIARLGQNAARYRVSSAGMLPIEGRPSPPQAVSAAERFQVDLTPHRSQHLSRSLAGDADLIILFDHRNAVALANRYPQAAEKAVKLGSFVDAAHDIEDPYGRSVEEFSATYHRISQGIDRLVEQLA